MAEEQGDSLAGSAHYYYLTNPPTAWGLGKKVTPSATTAASSSQAPVPEETRKTVLTGLWGYSGRGTLALISPLS